VSFPCTMETSFFPDFAVTALKLASHDPITQHRHFRGERSRDGAGREEDWIARKEAHGGAFLNGDGRRCFVDC
jgi:hypothetical protein